MRVVEGRPGLEEGQQPVVGVLQRAAPARGVERLAPDPVVAVEVRHRAVHLDIALVVASGGAEPAVSAEVVGVELGRLDRLPAAGGVQLVGADQHSVPGVPLAQRTEEGLLGELRPGAVVVAEHLGAVLGGLRRPERGQHVEQVVAAALGELLGQPRGPGVVHRQLVLEAPGDHPAEPLGHPALELAVHQVAQGVAGLGGQVVVGGPQGVGQGNRGLGGGFPVDQAPVVAEGDPPPVGVVRGDRGGQRRYGDPPVGTDLELGAVQRGPGVLGMVLRQSPLQIGSGEPDLVVEPDPHPQPFADLAGIREAVPPLLAEPERVVGRGSDHGAGRSEVDDDDVLHALPGQLLQLLGEPLRSDLLPTPPPQRRGGELGGRFVEQAGEFGVHAVLPLRSRRGWALR